MIPAGVHLDLPEDDYYSDSALSCSMAKVLARPGGPAKLWISERESDRDTKAGGQR